MQTRHKCVHMLHTCTHTHTHTHTHMYTHTHPSGGSSRSFVRVTSNIESTTRPTITCEFTNQLDSSNKSCNVSYGLCGQQLSRTAQGSSSPEEPNIIRVELDLSDPAAMYCYTVSASNDTFTAVVDSNSPTMATEATTTGSGGE